MNRRTLLVVLAGIAVVGVVAVAVIFKPWLLFVNVEVDDALPSVAPTVAPEPDPTETTNIEPAPVQLSAGTFISHEHATTGSVRVVLNTDGSRVLAIENLTTSSGPDVHVWLSASDVVEGVDGWYTAGSAPYLDLGPIKGNLGNQVYEIPEGVDISSYRSVSLWCVQFSVSFGAAQLV